MVAQPMILTDTALYITIEELETLTPEYRARLHERLRERFDTGKVSQLINTLADVHQQSTQKEESR